MAAVVSMSTALPYSGLAVPSMMPGMVVELAAHLHHHGACGAAHGLHGHGAKQVGNQPADEQANDDQRVRQVEA